MNILFLTTHCNAGGITSYLLTLSKGLINKGHNIFLISSGGDQEGVFRELGVKVYDIDLKTKSELSLKIYLSIIPIIKFIKENKIDIIHAQTRVTQVLMSILKNFVDVHCVGTCHGFFKTRLSRKIFKCWGDSIIAVSKPVKRHLIDDFCVDENKVYVINSGIDTHKFAKYSKDDRQKQREALGLKEEDFIIGMVARLSDVKGQDIIIKAMPKIIKKAPNAKLLLCGQGKLEYYLRGLTKSLGLKDTVIFNSMINQSVLLLNTFDVLAVPSRQEGLGLSVMEAQSCQLPVIASNVGGIPNIIEDGKTGLLVQPENPDLLAEAVIYLYKNSEIRNKLGKAAREFIVKEDFIGNMIKKTEQVYINS